MMELFKTLEELRIDPVIVMSIFAGGFWAKKYLDGWTHIRIGKWRPKFTTAWKTLIVGSIFTALYIAIMIMTGNIDQELILKYFYSYVTATSFYEIILDPVRRGIQSTFGKKQQENESE
jgi:hypothetical protein